MSNKLLISALAAMMAVITTAEAPAAAKKKKPVQSEQTEESANKDAMDDVALDIATGLLGGVMKKGKMPKGGKLIMKQGLKAVKASAKKSRNDSKSKEPRKNKPLGMLFGGDDE
ncbi:hypothetical protein [Rhizobium sp.]